MAQRILIASGNPWAFCMAVERDFVRRHPEAAVDALDLFKLCARASPHWRPRDKVIETLNRNFDRFVTPVISGRDITSSIRIDKAGIPALPRNYQALRSYKLDGANIGLAVVSSVSSLTTILEPSSLDEFGSVLEPAWRSAHISSRIGQAVRGFGYDKIVIFNGRHCYSRPFCDVLDGPCEVFRYEQGSAGNRYIAAPQPVQEPATLTKLIETHAFDPEAGHAFYRDRMNRDASTEVSLFAAEQRAGVLPEGMRAGEAVAFFTSSSDEMAAVTDNPLYGSFATQYDIALALADACRNVGLQPVVRLHPHLRFKHPSWRREWDFGELERRGALIVGPDEAADSYAILRASRAVLTSGSTIGLEAAYLGIPNGVVGKWVGACLGASVAINNADQVARFVANPQVLPDSRDRALLFGSFFKSAGRRLPELDVGEHANFMRIGGRIVDRVRYPVQKLRDLVRRRPHDPAVLDVRSGLQGGRVVLAPGTDYSSAHRQGKAARSG